MSEPIKISTTKYNTKKAVSIDGHLWEIRLPGAGTELKMSQAQRRLQLLQKKVDNGTATEEDLDKYDEYEAVMYDVFRGLFRDKTKDNSEVNKWIDETPTSIISSVFDDIKASGDGKNTEEKE